MADRMEEKVAVTMFKQDHDESWAQAETRTKLIYRNNARGALEACHHEELVTALTELRDAIPEPPPVLKTEFPEETNRLITARDKARAILAKVKEAGHG